MNDELEMVWNENGVSCFKEMSHTWMKVVKKIMKNVGHYNGLQAEN
jgi:hypothetical protein